MDVNIKPSIDIPEFLQTSTEVDFIFYAFFLVIIISVVIFVFLGRLRKSLKLIEIKRDIRSDKISHKEAAYSIGKIVDLTNITTIKALSNQDMLEIKSLKYMEHHITSKRVVINILDKLVFFTLLGKY